MFQTMKANIISCLLLFCYQSISAQEVLMHTPDTIKQRLILTTLYRLVANNYVYPEKGAAIVESLKTQHQLGLYNNVNTDQAFAEAPTKDIRKVYNDKHI